MLPANLRGIRLPPGRYCYLGNARGPGGIRARCSRHLRRPAPRGPGTRRWHVDWLTEAASAVRALAIPDGSECALVARLLEERGATVPVAGFGSSDCRRCAAHLLRPEAQLTVAEIAARLRGIQPKGEGSV